LTTRPVFPLRFNVGNHAVAAIKVPEEYEALRIALGNIRKEVNDLITKGVLEVGDRTVKVEFFLGGDYNVHCHFKLILPSYKKVVHVVYRQPRLANWILSFLSFMLPKEKKQPL